MSLYHAFMLCFLDFIGLFGFAVGYLQLVGTLLRPSAYRAQRLPLEVPTFFSDIF